MHIAYSNEWEISRNATRVDHPTPGGNQLYIHIYRISDNNKMSTQRRLHIETHEICTFMCIVCQYVHYAYLK